MRKFIPINDLFHHIKRRSIGTWIDRLKFPYIFLIWACVVGIFGLAYHSMSDDQSYLYHPVTGTHVSSIADSVYFSFITATTTGFGDIIPNGSFKMIAIVEVIFGLMLLALVTSKLVSIKQDVILNEVYDISLKERINRLRSSLFLFRQNLNRIISRIEEESIKKREVKEFYSIFSTFEDTLNDVRAVVGKRGDFLKGIDPLSAELLSNSILNSFEKLLELIEIANEKNLQWRRDITVGIIKRSIKTADGLFKSMLSSKTLKRNLESSNEQYQVIVSDIRKSLNSPE